MQVADTTRRLESELDHYRMKQRMYMEHFYRMQSAYVHGSVAEIAIARARMQLDKVNSKCQELIEAIEVMEAIENAQA